VTYAELELEITALRPTLSSESLKLLDIFIPFCNHLVAENASLSAENAALRSQVSELTHRLSSNSSNSSSPPSKDIARVSKPRSRRENSGKKRGGQKGHKGHVGHFFETPDETILHSIVGSCGHCGTSLATLPVTETLKRQIVDIPAPCPQVIEHHIEVKACPNCGKEWMSSDENIPAQNFTYGPYVQALAVYFSARHMLPVARSAELFEQFGINISVGTLDNFRKRAAKELGDFYKALQEKMQNCKSAHFDETGIHINGQRHWLHVSSEAFLSYYHVDAQRGGQAIENMGILPQFKGVSHHDCYSSYNNYPNAIHSLCNAHLLRELKAVIDRQEDNENWATSIIKILMQAKKLVEKTADNILDKRWQARVKNQILKWVGVGLQHHPKKERPPSQKKGKVKQSKTHNLIIRIKENVESFLRFTTITEAQFDNNQAERDIRMNKVKEKVSGGFRALDAAKEFAIIRSFIDTLRKQGRDVVQGLHLMLCGKLNYHQIINYSPE